MHPGPCGLDAEPGTGAERQRKASRENESFVAAVQRPAKGGSGLTGTFTTTFRLFSRAEYSIILC